MPGGSPPSRPLSLLDVHPRPPPQHRPGARAPDLLALLLLLAELLAGVLELLGGHLLPALPVALDALALRGGHGLVAVEALLELLLALAGRRW